jgi:hypothetical protein
MTDLYNKEDEGDFMKRVHAVSLAFFLLCLAACSSGKATETPTFTSMPVSIDTQAPASPTAEAAQPTDTPAGTPGSISGTILTPENIPPLIRVTVYAREVDTGAIYSVQVPDGQTTYQISNIPQGVYYAIAYSIPDGIPQGVGGAFTSSGIVSADSSAAQMKCDNSLTEITLSSGNMDFQGADIGCWGGNSLIYLTPIP